MTRLSWTFLPLAARWLIILNPESLWVDGTRCLARRPFFVGTPTHPGTPIMEISSTCRSGHPPSRVTPSDICRPGSLSSNSFHYFAYDRTNRAGDGACLFHGTDTTVGDFGNREGRLRCINAIIATANYLLVLERLGSRKLRMRKR